MDEEYLDNLARETYQLRSGSSREMTDERWERIKTKFPATVRMLKEEIEAHINLGEFEEYA